MARPKEVTDEDILKVARRCFLERGAGVTAVDIASELGVSHTTLFNRFGSKEALMIAALGPSKEVGWVVKLEDGPDDRPIRDQLIEHSKVMAVYFQELQTGLSMLQAAGISINKLYADRTGDSPPVRAFRALTQWLKLAQNQGRLGECDVDTLSTMLLGVLHNRAFTECVCGVSEHGNTDDHFVEQYIDLLWNGIGKTSDDA